MSKGLSVSCLNLIVILVLIHCLNAVIKKTMTKRDMMGNVLTLALVVYLGFIFAVKLLPDLNTDVGILQFLGF